MTTTLHSFAIFVTDLERARIFYEEQLGLPLNKKRGSFGFQFLHEEPHLSVHPAQHPSAVAMIGRETGITFAVKDLVTLCARLDAEHVPVVAGPIQQGFGLMAMVADPDGNLMALWEDNVSPPAEEA